MKEKVARAFDQSSSLVLEVNVSDPAELGQALAAFFQSVTTRTAGFNSVDLRTLEPGFSALAWLGTYPLTSASHQKKLLALLAKAGL